MKIALALDPRNDELNISLIDLLTDRLIEFWLFGEMVGDAEAATMGSLVLTPVGAPDTIQRFASAIERHLDILSNWNAEFASRLYSRQLEISEEEWRAERLNDALRLAQPRWHSKDYAAFVQLLSPFERDLSPATLKKLDYARAHA